CGAATRQAVRPLIPACFVATAVRPRLASLPPRRSLSSNPVRFAGFRSRSAGMERRKFGDTGLEVSAISLGCWIFGVDWWGHYTQEQANRHCSFSYDLGITYFDNGDAYGNGRAETL